MIESSKMLIAALIVSSQLATAAVERWEASDLADGAVSSWVSQGALATTASVPASNGGDPVKDADGVYFDGNDALEIPAGSNFMAGDPEWTATVVFKADSALGQGGATRPTSPQPNNLRQWWSNAALVGRELPGSNSGDWGIFMNSEDELVCGNGGTITAGYIWQDHPMADGAWHVATVTFSTTKKNRTLYVDGRAVHGQQTVTINNPADSINFGCNILGNANDRAYFTGHIKTIILEDRALSFLEVQALHESLGYARGSWLPPVTREQSTVSLFNGTNFNEWGMSIQNNPNNNSIGDDIWSVLPEGSAFAAASGESQSALYTLRQDYGNYELTFDFQYTEVKNFGNSGVWILGSPDFVDSNGAFPKSIEVQLRKGEYVGDLLLKQLSLDPEPGYEHLVTADGARPNARFMRRADPNASAHSVWHSVKIVTRVTTNEGSTIEVWMNGVFVNKGINCSRDNGCICFQAEGHDIKFRNIQIKESKLTYDHWIERFDLPAGQQDETDSPVDEFSNFEKYALGLDSSTVHSRSDALSISNLVVNFKEPLYTADAALDFQQSTNLVDWAPVSSTAVSSNEASLYREHAVAPLEDREFFRLQVVAP